MTQDLYYYESGYIDESYFVYTADAESQQTATSSISCDASIIGGGVIVTGYSGVNSFATMSVTVSHIYGADLNGFSDAALTAQASLIKNNNAQLSSQFTVGVSAVRGIYVQAQADSIADVSTVASRFRGIEAAHSAAFSLAANCGKVIDASSTELSAFGAGISCDVFKNSFAVLDSVASVTVTATKSIITDANISSTATLSFTGRKIGRILLPTVFSNETNTKYAGLSFSSTTNKFGSSLRFEPKESSTQPNSSAVYGSAGWLILRPGGEILISVDGTNWTKSNANFSEQTFGYGYEATLKYLNGKYIRSDVSYLNNSTNGITWTSIANPNIYARFEDMSYANGNYIGVYGYSGTAYIKTSTDLSTWTSRVSYYPYVGASSSFVSIISSGTRSVAVGYVYDSNGSNKYAPLISYSTNGTTWTTSTVGSSSGTNMINRYFNSVATDGTTWISVGRDNVTNQIVVYSSTTAALGTWTYVTSLSSPSNGLNCKILYANGKWVLTDSNNLWTSTNGTNWSATPVDISYPDPDTGITFYCSDITYGNSTWVLNPYSNGSRSTNDTILVKSNDNGLTWDTFNITSVIGNLQPYVRYPTSNYSIGNYSVDFWFNSDSYSDSITSSFYLVYSDNIRITLSLTSSGITVDDSWYSSPTSITSGAWHHFRFIQSGTSYSWYIDGVRKKTGTISGTPTNSYLYVGGIPGGIINNCLGARGNVYIDELYITETILNSTSTTTFTVPTTPWTNTSTTRLLTHFDGDLTDDSPLIYVTASASLTVAASISANISKTSLPTTVNLSSAFTVSSNINWSGYLKANLSSNITLSCNGNKTIIKEFSSSLVSQFTTDIPYVSFTNKRPHSAYKLGTIAGGITSVDKKYGSYSYRQAGGTGAYNQGLQIPTKNLYVQDGEDFYMSMWTKWTLNVSQSATYRSILSSGSGSYADDWAFGVLINGGQATPYFSYGHGGAAGSPQYLLASNPIAGTASVQDNVWCHWEIYRSGSTLTFKFTPDSGPQSSYTLIGSVTYNGQVNFTNNYVIYTPPIAGAGQTDWVYIDEIFFAKGVSSVQSRNTDNSIADGAASTTQWLFNFENNYQDTTTGIQKYNANLNSNASLVSNAGKNLVSSANLVSQSLQEVSLTKIQLCNAVITSTGSLLIAAGRIRPFVDLEISSTTLTATVDVVKEFASSQDSQSSLSVIPTKQQGAVIVTFPVESYFNLDGNKFAGANSQVSVDSTLSVTISKFASFVEITGSTATLSALGNVTKPFSSTQQSTTSLSAIATKQFGVIESHLSTEVAVVTDAIKKSVASANLQVEGFEISDVNINTRASANLVATSTIVAYTESGKIGECFTNVTSSLTCTITKQLGVISGNLNADSALLATTIANRTVIANLDIQGFVVSVNGRIRAEVADLAVEFNLSSSPTTIVDFKSNVNSSSSIDCAITKQLGEITANLATDTNLSADVLALPSGSVACHSESSMAVDADRIRGIDAQLAVNAFELAVNQVSRSLVANLTTTSTLASTALRIKQLNANFESVGTDVTVINKVGNTLVHCAVQTTLSCNLSEIKRDVVIEVSAATLIANVTQIKGTQANLQSSSSLTATPGKQVQATASLQVQGFELAFIRSIRLDNAENWKIKPDNNYWKIPKDINLDDAIVYRVPHETRGWKIPQETNYYTVVFENRNYKIKG